MKIGIAIICTLLMVANTGCKQEHIKELVAEELRIVHADGTDLQVEGCLSPDLEYAVKIEANPVVSGSGYYLPLTVPYLVNGNVFSLVIEKPGYKISPVNLIEGINTISISGSDLSIEVKVISQGDFILVN